MLFAAEEHTILCNHALKESEISFAQTKIELNKSTDEVNELSIVLERQQEIVRKYLLKKEKPLGRDITTADDNDETTLPLSVAEIQDENDDEGSALPSSSSIEEEGSTVTLEELKEEEKLLEAEFKKLEDRLLHIQSKRESLSPSSTKLFSC